MESSEQVARRVEKVVRITGELTVFAARCIGGAVKYSWEAVEQAPENVSGKHGARGAVQFAAVASLFVLLLLTVAQYWVAWQGVVPETLALPLIVGMWSIPMLNVRRRILTGNARAAQRVWLTQLVITGVLLVAISAITIGVTLVNREPLPLVGGLVIAVVGTYFYRRQIAYFRQGSPEQATLGQPRGLPPGYQYADLHLPVIEQDGTFVNSASEQQQDSEVRENPIDGSQSAVRREIGKLRGLIQDRRVERHIVRERQAMQEQERAERSKREREQRERLARVLRDVDPEVLYRQSLALSAEQAQRYCEVLGMDISAALIDDDELRGLEVARQLVERFHGQEQAAKLEGRVTDQDHR